MPFYAIAKGHVPGIYTNWNEAKVQIERFKGPVFKKFDTEVEAANFISQRQSSQNTNTHQEKLTSFFQVSEPHETNQTLIVFTDGSSLNNGRANSKSGYAVIWPFHTEYNYSEFIPNGTNNIAEMSAIIKAIEIADSQLDPDFTKTLILYTDSMLLVNTITKWMSTWKKNNWKKSDGEIVANLGLIKRLDFLLQTRKISVKHVKAHTKENTWEAKWNNEADILARDASTR